MSNILIFFILFTLRCDISSSEDNDIILRRAGGKNYLSNKLPSLFIESFSKVVKWKGEIPLPDIRRDIDAMGYDGHGSATNGYLTSDMSSMTFLDYTPWNYGSGVRASYTFRIPEIKINYKIRVDTPCSITGNLKAKLYKAKMTIYVVATKQNGRCRFQEHWDWTRFTLETREYDYDLENVDYSWYNWVVVTSARTAAQGVVYSEMGDSNGFLINTLQRLLQEGLRYQVKDAFFMAVNKARNNGVDVCQEFLSSY